MATGHRDSGPLQPWTAPVMVDILCASPCNPCVPRTLSLAQTLAQTSISQEVQPCWSRQTHHSLGAVGSPGLPSARQPSSQVVPRFPGSHVTCISVCVHVCVFICVCARTS